MRLSFVYFILFILVVQFVLKKMLVDNVYKYTNKKIVLRKIRKIENRKKKENSAAIM